MYKSTRLQDHFTLFSLLLHISQNSSATGYGTRYYLLKVAMKMKYSIEFEKKS